MLIGFSSITRHNQNSSNSSVSSSDNSNEYGCSLKNPCHKDFECVNKRCMLILNSNLGNCKISGSEAECISKNVVIKAPSNNLDFISKNVQVLQYQYDFLLDYLDFEPNTKIIYQEFVSDVSKYCSSNALGCAIGDHTYWPVEILNPNNTKWVIEDHEFNHAFWSDINLNHDLNEAFARYLSLKESEYANGYDSVLDFLKPHYRIIGYFFTINEENWKSMIDLPASDACKTLSVRQMEGENAQNASLQCQYYFNLVKYNQRNLAENLLKDAFDKKIDISTKENVDKQMNAYFD